MIQNQFANVMQHVMRFSGFKKLKKTLELNIPGSVSRPGGGCCDNGPGVLPLPGDLASSFIAPPYDSEELGGLCNNDKREKITQTN